MKSQASHGSPAGLQLAAGISAVIFQLVPYYHADNPFCPLLLDPQLAGLCRLTFCMGPHACTEVTKNKLVCSKPAEVCLVPTLQGFRPAQSFGRLATICPPLVALGLPLQLSMKLKPVIMVLCRRRRVSRWRPPPPSQLWISVRRSCSHCTACEMTLPPAVTPGLL